MVKRIIYTEISPQLEAWFGQSWPRILAVGLGLVLVGILVLTFPRLDAFLVALALFLAAAVVLLTAYRLWQLSRSDHATQVKID